jgi:hypothetical protein
MAQRSIGVKRRKHDVIAFVKTETQFIHRGSYVHIVTVDNYRILHESNESLKITRLRNPIVCSGLFLEQTQAYIYIRLIASGIDKIHNCLKCLKEKHFQNLVLGKYTFKIVSGDHDLHPRWLP